MNGKTEIQPRSTVKPKPIGADQLRARDAIYQEFLKSCANYVEKKDAYDRMLAIQTMRKDTKEATDSVTEEDDEVTDDQVRTAKDEMAAVNRKLEEFIDNDALIQVLTRLSNDLIVHKGDSIKNSYSVIRFIQIRFKEVKSIADKILENQKTPSMLLMDENSLKELTSQSENRNAGFAISAFLSKVINALKIQVPARPKP